MTDATQKRQQYAPTAIWVIGLAVCLLAVYLIAYLYSSNDVDHLTNVVGEAQGKIRYYEYDKQAKLFVPLAWLEGRVTGKHVAVASDSGGYFWNP